MPAWIAAALRLLAAGVIGGAGFELGTGAFGRDVGTPSILDLDVIRDAAGNIITRAHRGGRRHRRRRALTASDRADIAFIAGMISKAAAKDFAVQLAARPR